MMKPPPRFVVAVALLSVGTFAAEAANAQSRFRARLGIGDGDGRPIRLSGGGNDLPTLCDRHVNPNRTFVPRSNPECASGVGASEWTTDFDRGEGIVANLAVDYRVWRGAHAEVELQTTHLSYHLASAIVPEVSSIAADVLAQEIARAEERIGDVRLSMGALNLFYEFPVFGRVRVFAGGGVGFGQVQLDHGAEWTRSLDPSRITTVDDANAIYAGPADGDREAERELLRQRIAGATTTADAVHHGRRTRIWQAMGGLKVRITDRTDLEVRLPYVRYESFESDGEWDQLRSHASNNALLPGDGGSDPARYFLRTDDLGGLALVFSFVIR